MTVEKSGFPPVDPDDPRNKPAPVPSVSEAGVSLRYLASERASIDYCNDVVDGSGRLL